MLCVFRFEMKKNLMDPYVNGVYIDFRISPAKNGVNEK